MVYDCLFYRISTNVQQGRDGSNVNSSNNRALEKISLFHALLVFSTNRLAILANCMTNNNIIDNIY